MENDVLLNLDIDYMELLYEDNAVSIVECFVLHTGVNRNKCNITKEVVLNALPSLANKPIWGIPDNKYLRGSSSDFLEHARSNEAKDDIMIFGVFPESSIKNAEFIEMNDKEYLKVQAVLWKVYAPVAMSILNKRDNNVKISIEIIVKGNQNEQGILDIEEMSFWSATALGLKYPEGIENSQMNVIRFSVDDAIQESNSHYLTFAKKEHKYANKIKETLQNKNKVLAEVDTLYINSSKEVENVEDEVKTNADEEVIENKEDEVKDEKIENADEEVKEEQEEKEEKIENAEDEVDWKNKYEEMETECKNCKNELQMALDKIAQFERKEEEVKMSKMLEEFSHCYSNETKEEMSKEIKTCSFEEFKVKIDDKVREFALSAKDKKEDKQEEVEVKNELQFSFIPFVKPETTYNFSNKMSNEEGLDGIIKNSGVKIK